MKPAQSTDSVHLVNKALADEYRGLFGPFLTIGGKLICLLILVPTALMEGVYVGLKHAAAVLEKGM